MPPWVACVPRSSCLRTSRTIERLSLPFSPPRTVQSSTTYLRTRRASTHVAPTAINVRPNIPPQSQELYDALDGLSKHAAEYVNISRLQLAQRGVTTQDAVVRIAILSLNSQKSAQMLARLLLADPLGTEGQWEKTLEESEEDGRAMLLRHGNEGDANTASPLYKILSVPSRILGAHHLEILVSTLNVNTSHAAPVSTNESSQDALLVPKIQAPTARGLPIPYPVHKTLVIGQGLGSAVDYGKFTADTVGDNYGMVKVAIHLPPPSTDADPGDSATYSPVNIDTGVKALTKFRESIANSEFFERGWFRSGVPGLSKWLVRDLQSSGPVKPAIRTLIGSIADDVEANITKLDTQQLNRLAAVPTYQQTSESVLRHLETWAEKSHTELRDQLDEAFTAPNWYKLVWWKLLWRVDDVTMITEEILQKKWLVDAEKNSIYLAGRMNQAGFPEVLQVVQEVVVPEPLATLEGNAPIDPRSRGEQTPTDISTEVKEIIPWPSQMAASRTILLKDTIPPLQAFAQRLVLQTLSTTSLSSALSALLYVAMPTFSVFEAGAVAALGFVYSLRRMQKLWESTREMWQAELREEGRKTLKHTEETVRLIVRRTERPTMENEGAVGRKRAREAVLRVREALGRV
ncbi:hypothetical protein BDV96DRAFT_578003 [Lophiotrema nucula]|uniref:Mmc1 C-terminal domain-containing protein n=1 Tax=Lophiotrema nucula TaxID=690887 RepID=A0A6A5Z395_9PLEO|nr:hypothetical protein BDV96DRAFT_578003 [Lophiotrema nucula]